MGASITKPDDENVRGSNVCPHCGRSRSTTDPLSLTDNHEFITDLARFSEGLYSEADVKKKYRFDDTTWKKLGEDDALIEAIELERTRRIRNGAAKREKAQQLVVKAPDILDSIMSDTSVSPKHRIDSAKVLDAFTGNAAETTMASERFVITINLGEDYKLKFDKSITPVANDKDVEIIDNNTGVLAAVAASKREDNGGGEPI